MSGCVREDLTADGTQTFRYEYWVPMLSAFGGAAAILVAPAIMKFNRKFGVMFIIVGLIAIFMVTPSMYTDFATVGPERFTSSGHKLGFGRPHEFAYEDLSSVRFVEQTYLVEGGDRRSDFCIMCEFPDGRTRKIAMGSRVIRTAAPHLARRLLELGIPVVDETHGFFASDIEFAEVTQLN